MTRETLAPGEKPLFWMGSSREDLVRFPGPVREEIGAALSVAQFGDKHPSAKPWKGERPGIFEIVADFRSDTYRVVYTVRFSKAIYVLHAFQKKSPTGIRTSRRDVELIQQRMKMALQHHEARYGQEE